MANFYPGQELRGEEEDYEDASWIQTSRTRGPKMTGSKQLYNVTVTVEKVFLWWLIETLKLICFLCPASKDRGHTVLLLSVCLSVHPSGCLHKLNVKT